MPCLPARVRVGCTEQNCTTNLDILNNTLGADDVIESNLNGAELVNVEQCPAAATRFGDICARNINNSNTINWRQAATDCAAVAMRLPTLGEAVLFAKNHDVPGVGTFQAFYTDEFADTSVSPDQTVWVDENGEIEFAGDVGVTSDAVFTICVSIPNSNAG